jgi:hypothetical protein
MKSGVITTRASSRNTSVAAALTIAAAKYADNPMSPAATAFLALAHQRIPPGTVRQEFFALSIPDRFQVLATLAARGAI